MHWPLREQVCASLVAFLPSFFPFFLPAYLDGNAVWVESTGKSLNSRLATISDASSAVASAAARSDALCTAELDDDDE